MRLAVVWLGCGLALSCSAGCLTAQAGDGGRTTSQVHEPGGVMTGGVAPHDPSTGWQPVADPVLGFVEGHPIYLSELGAAAATLPEAERSVPFDKLYPVLLDRVIDHQALVIMARHAGLEEQNQVRRTFKPQPSGSWRGRTCSAWRCRR